MAPRTPKPRSSSIRPSSILSRWKAGCAQVVVFELIEEAIDHSLTELWWPFLSFLGTLSSFKMLVLVTSIASDIEFLHFFLAVKSWLVVQLSIEVVAKSEHTLVATDELKWLETFIVIEALFHQVLHVEAVPELTGPGILK